MGWKEWVAGSKKTGVSLNFLTHAVAKGDLRPPTEKDR
jgi:hypothetical protein